MRLPDSEHRARPWRIHELVADFTLEDVWALPMRGGPDEFGSLLAFLGSFDGANAESTPARFLWNLRQHLGRWLNLDGTPSATDTSEANPSPDASQTSLLERVPADLRATESDQVFSSALPFVPLYRTDREAAAEVSNRVVHGVAHLSWVEVGDGLWEGRMAVYVKPRGVLGRAYMASIKPFRHWIVYPALMGQLGRAWERRRERMGTAAAAPAPR